MAHRQAINNFLMYMWNHWSFDTCMEIFGERLGHHIWGKWIAICQDYGSTGGVAVLWSQLDAECQYALADKANGYYKPIDQEF